MKRNYKGLILAIVIATSFAAPVAPVSAVTEDEVTLESLTALIDSLKAQILDLQEQQNLVQETRKELRLSLLRFLQEGATGEDVEELQAYLALDSDIYAQGLITGFYGPLTAAAVRKFQQTHGIDQAGVVGPMTTAKLNQLFGDGLGPDGTVPPALTHAPGIEKKGGFCAIPGIAAKFSVCDDFDENDFDDDDEDEEEDDEEEDEDEDEDELEAEGIVESISDDELVLEDDTIFIINDDTEIDE